MWGARRGCPQTDDLQHPHLQEVSPLGLQETQQVALHLLQLPALHLGLHLGLHHELQLSSQWTCGDHSVQREGGRSRH